MALEINRNNFAFKQCGEISTYLPAGRKEFFLSCGFCELTFLDLNHFVDHIFEDHSLEILDAEIKQDVELDIPLDLQESFSDEAESHPMETDGDGRLTVFETVEIIEASKSNIALEDNTHDFIKREIISDNDDMETDFSLEFDPKAERALIKEINSQMNQETFHGMKKKSAQSDSKVNVLHERKNKLKTCNTKCPRKYSILDDVQCISLAEIYKLHTCLWNEEDIAYRFKNRRDEALRAVFNTFITKTGLNLSQQDLEKEIISLRKICSNEKKIKIENKNNHFIHKPTYPFYEHISFLEVDVAPFECSKCGKLLPGLGQFKVHFAEHDGSLPFKCNICGHGFQLGNNLTVHLRRHVQEYKYKCEVCNKPCITSTEIKIHMRSHTDEKPFVCSICGERARTSSHLSFHMHKRHEKKPRHKCKLCPKMFYENKRLHEHMAVHKNIRDHICSVCNKGFKSAKQLGQHQLIHNAQKKYLCKICGKRFAQSSGLCGHMKSHGTKLAATLSDSAT